MMHLPWAWLAFVASKGGADDAADRALGVASLCWAWPALVGGERRADNSPCRRKQRANDATNAFALCVASSLCDREEAADAGDALALGVASLCGKEGRGR